MSVRTLSVELLVAACIGLRIFAVAQTVPYVGFQGGISTLSSDSRAVLVPQGLSSALYTPENGGVLTFLGGMHFNNFLSVQGNYSRNRNDLVLSSASSASFFLERRTSTQNAFTVDALVYFRPLKSRIRPYLSVGTGVTHFSSVQQQLLGSGGTPVLPPRRFSSIRPVLHVPVGIDVALTRRISFRYSFSETIQQNDISRQLSPPGQRRLANFQNLFGAVFCF